MPLAHWPRLTLWTAFAVARGIQTYADEFLEPEAAPRIMLKWPNDLYASGRKLAGILVESSLGDESFAPPASVSMSTTRSFPLLWTPQPLRLRIQTGSSLNRNALAAAILASIDQAFSLPLSPFQEILDWASVPIGSSAAGFRQPPAAPITRGQPKASIPRAPSLWARRPGT